jgi:hypothetical protein
MTKVFARIIIDSDDGQHVSPATGEHPVILWKRVETTHALPFSKHELEEASSLLGDEYFV